MPRFCSISSSGTFLVSGMTLRTQTNWPIMHTKNSANAAPPPSSAAMPGNAQDTTAANTQCVRLPSD